VPLGTAAKVEALSIDFRSQAALAEMLGVSRSRVTRWLKGAGIDPLNAEKVDLLELVWSNLLRVYEPDAARSWLLGHQSAPR
jgi:transcriptional regulator with XRE-family HTH domain